MNFSEEFQNGETLLRGVLPCFWSDDYNRPFSSAFKKKKDEDGGISVNRTGENRKCYDESFEQLVKNKKGTAFKVIVELNVEFCQSEDLNLYLKYRPTEDNDYHSEIHKSKDEPALTNSQAKKLAEVCRIIA